MQAEIQTTASVYSTVKSEHSSQFGAAGITPDDANHAFVAQATPLSGRWVRVGTTVVMSDSDGIFVLPSGTSGTDLAILSEAGDTTPITVFSLSRLDQNGATRDLVVKIIHQGPVQMEQQSGHVKAPSCCSPPALKSGRSTTFNPGRCLDWDNPLGDHIQYSHLDPRGVWNYVNSTCWKNVNSGLCAIEGNTITNGLLMTGGPHCWQNHGFRMCQDVREDEFDITSSVSSYVLYGDTVAADITNNTAGNDTLVTLGGTGVLSSPGSAAAGTQILVHHYDSTKHLVSRTVSYVADLPPGVDEKDVRITARSHGHTKSISFKVYRHKPIDHIDVIPSQSTLDVGRTVTLSPTARAADNSVVQVPSGSFQFATSDVNIVSIDTKGLAFAMRPGRAIVGVTLPGTSVGGTASFVVNVPPSTDFGSVEVGSSSSGQGSWIIQGDEGQSVTYHSVSFIGPNAADFSLTFSAPFGVPQPVGTAIFDTLTFAPTSYGLRQATLRYDWTNVDGIRRITDYPMTGYGLPRLGSRPSMKKVNLRSPNPQKLRN